MTLHYLNDKDFHIANTTVFVCGTLSLMLKMETIKSYISKVTLCSVLITVTEIIKISEFLVVVNYGLYYNSFQTTKEKKNFWFLTQRYHPSKFLGDKHF